MAQSRTDETSASNQSGSATGGAGRRSFLPVKNKVGLGTRIVDQVSGDFIGDFSEADLLGDSEMEASDAGMEESSGAAAGEAYAESPETLDMSEEYEAIDQEYAEQSEAIADEMQGYDEQIETYEGEVGDYIGDDSLLFTDTFTPLMGFTPWMMDTFAMTSMPFMAAAFDLSFMAYPCGVPMY